MIFRLNPQIQSLNFIRDLDTEPSFQPYLNSFKADSQGGFDFAFGTSTDLDPRIATYEVNEVYMYFSQTEKEANGEPKRMKTKRSLEIGKCGQKGFNYPMNDEIDKFSIDALHCLKKKDY